ncbi:MAG TPA: FAD-binding protein [Polyangiales bacterium]|nr:FAD-binding protein [Polyangiales bacterium]
MTESPQGYLLSGVDHSCDFLVIGSGGGGMVAALRAHDLGLDVLVIEASDKFGGSTGMSGGALWVPNNPHMAGAGIADTPEEAFQYLQRVTREGGDDARARVYVKESAEMVRYLEARTQVKLSACPQYCDYYPEYPGGKPGARTIEPVPYSARKLGVHADELRRSGQGLVLGRMGLTAVEAHTLVQFSLRAYLLMLWIFLRYWLDLRARRKGKADNRLTLGTALVGRLRRSLLDRDVPLWLKTPAKELIVQDGRVVGALVEREGKPMRIGARHGVLLASGGFERNLEMRQRYQRAPITATWTAGNPHNLGDGIRMGEAVGGGLGLMDEAWWTPVTLLPNEYAWLLVVEKSMPGGILVNKSGQRFTNEAAPYGDVVHEIYRANQPEGATIPCYLVFDARYRRSYPVGPLGPSKLQPDSAIGKRLRREFLNKAGSLAELAARIGVDAAGLEQTVARFNDQARRGQDEDYGRGSSAYDRYYSDAKIQPNPSLAPIVEAPFYAIAVYPGDLGTKGGLLTDVHARVLRADQSVIPGLYAAGNCTASVMGTSYPGAGGTIGPAMTFGYVAAAHAAAAASVSKTESVAAE